MRNKFKISNNDSFEVCLIFVKFKKYFLNLKINSLIAQNQIMITIVNITWYKTLKNCLKLK